MLKYGLILTNLFLRPRLKLTLTINLILVQLLTTIKHSTPVKMHVILG